MAKKQSSPEGIEETIRLLAREYGDKLKKAIDQRMEEMKGDDRSHILIYQVLGVGDHEGQLVDEYQNKGRFLYKYAGSFLEEAAKLCFLETYPESGSVRIPNTQGQRPKTFEIDCLIAADAIEIKWRDATTDGDHITKEHTRIQAIVDAKHTPIRIMFYYPNRAQAIKIQQTLEPLCKGVKGQLLLRRRGVAVCEKKDRCRFIWYSHQTCERKCTKKLMSRSASEIAYPSCKRWKATLRTWYTSIRRFSQGRYIV